jgi:sugar phosphate isomerase/epimerase
LENPHFGIVYDPGNCIWEGYERPTVQVNMLGKLIKAVHVKNSAPQAVTAPPEDAFVPASACRLDQGLLNWPEIMAAIKASGFDNYITLEDSSSFATLEEKLKWDSEYVRELMG